LTAGAFVLSVPPLKSLLRSAFGQVPLVRLPLSTGKESLPGFILQGSFDRESRAHVSW
jgi:hypothetical protein